MLEKMGEMEIEEISVAGYERVVHARDPESGLNAFISVHSTALGPALGGLRMWRYASEAEALADANRLAKAMTYKAAVAETGQGGGKGVIVGDPGAKTPAMIRAMGRFIESLGGLYITAEDMNITEGDMDLIAEETRWVSGRSIEKGSSGNPSPMTAWGCLIGMEACLEEAMGDSSLRGRRVAIQGVGAVGSLLAGHCVERGARVAVCDLDGSRAEAIGTELGVEVLEGGDAALEYECDILSPCARGGVLNAETIPRLRCRIVAGAANNQLAEAGDAALLGERGILYAPDYVINAGGIINIACEFESEGYREARARERVKSIAGALRRVFEIARREGITTAEAADHLAEERIARRGSSGGPG